MIADWRKKAEPNTKDIKRREQGRTWFAQLKQKPILPLPVGQMNWRKS